MTESTGPADEVTATPSGKAAGGEAEDLHGTAREVEEQSREGSPGEPGPTPGGG
ncbi:hypothetical protein ACI8AC_05830 [Geodermatophilus sp. SYSU D00758]